MELVLPLTPPKSTFTPTWKYGAKEQLYVTLESLCSSPSLSLSVCKMEHCINSKLLSALTH